MGDPTDADLLDAFRAGDVRAFETLVRRYQRPVLAIARRFARDLDDAEDLAQRAFINASQRAGGWRGGTFKSWLFRIGAQEQRRLREAVARLPRRQREVLLLRIDGDLPFSEIARTLQITEVNAKVNFHHAVQNLKKLVQG